MGPVINPLKRAWLVLKVRVLWLDNTFKTTAGRPARFIGELVDGVVDGLVVDNGTRFAGNSSFWPVGCVERRAPRP